MTEPAPDESVTRRRLLLGGAAGLGIAVGAAVTFPFWPDRIKRVINPPPPAFIPDAEVGTVTLESVYSESRGMDVDLFTAVPAGYGNGKGLPVVVICHGATATPASYEPFGLPQFLTQAVDDGAEPFVLAGAYGSALRWEPQADGDDPRSMVLDEMPGWLEERGFDADRRALWGWSMGGYGVLRMAQLEPEWMRAVAAFAPAVSPGDAVFEDADALEGMPLGIWCGTDDSLFDSVEAFVESLPEEPEIWSYGPGGHTRIYWNDQTLEAFQFLASHL